MLLVDPFPIVPIYRAKPVLVINLTTSVKDDLEIGISKGRFSRIGSNLASSNAIQTLLENCASAKLFNTCEYVCKCGCICFSLSLCVFFIETKEYFGNTMLPY